MDLILASTSPYRRALLERLGPPFRAIDPGVDEDEIKRVEPDPKRLAERLAVAKATAIRMPETVVIGGDQLVASEGQILGKPGSVEAAIAQLSSLAGKTHNLVTALAVADPSGVWLHCDVTRLSVRNLTLDEVRRYVEVDRPLDCAGSYRLEARGITLFESIASSDHSAIIGLPLIALTTRLRQLGFAIP